MDLLLGLIETLSKSPQNLSVAERSSAQSQFTELTEAGFKLDWLKPNLKEVSLERKKALPDGSSVQELEDGLISWN
uniref:MATH domain and coiled-coil domain-containing protein n=1 Tax=Noccaea caerulescens TaxID=107243 RepID=A0A1J3GWD8_NOCCA